MSKFIAHVRVNGGAGFSEEVETRARLEEIVCRCAEMYKVFDEHIARRGFVAPEYWCAYRALYEDFLISRLNFILKKNEKEVWHFMGNVRFKEIENDE